VVEQQQPFDRGRPRPIATVLDSLRAQVDAERFDAAVVWIESVVADLGYGDVRPLPGAVGWISQLREEGKKIALASSGERAQAALELAGLGEAFDALASGPRAIATLEHALTDLGTEPERVGVRPADRRRPWQRHPGAAAPSRCRCHRRRPAGAAQAFALIV
jgi:hypothetical protein